MLKVKKKIQGADLSEYRLTRDDVVGLSLILTEVAKSNDEYKALFRISGWKKKNGLQFRESN